MYIKLIITFVCFSLFLGTPFLNSIGYAHANESASTFFKIHPATYISFILFGYLFLNYRSQLFLIFKYKKIYFYLLLSIILIISFLFLIHRTNSIAFIFDTLLAPTLFAIVYPTSNIKLKKLLLNILIFFFVLNCSLAIIERGFDFNVFPPKGNTEISGLRASALQGHPLNNGLITAILMAFIFLSQNKRKYFLLFLGLISLVCYGARGSLYGISILTFFFIIYQIIFQYKTSTQELIKNYKPDQKSLIGFLLGAIPVLYYLIVNTKFGERLMRVSYFDQGSAGTRVDVLNIVNNYSFSELIFGINQNKLDNSLWRIQIPIIENFWIQWLFKFGIIFSLLLIICLIRSVVKSVSQYKKIERFYLFIVFFIVASTNNSLATSTSAFSVFIISAFAFSPINKRVLNIKKLNNSY